MTTSSVRRVTFKLVLKEFIVPVAAMGAFLGGLALMAGYHASQEKLNTTEASSVFIKVGTSGHCTGVHIGDGYILTAEHCTKATLRVDGEFELEVLWKNAKYDVALTRLVAEERPEDLGTASLRCETPAVGTEVWTYGNPLDFKDLKVWGKVAGSTLKIGGMWDEIIPVQIAIAPGNSGGPLFNMDGEIVGLTVGGMSPFAGVSLTVPSSTICMLMGRK